jgi:hypothetical protein
VAQVLGAEFPARYNKECQRVAQEEGSVFVACTGDDPMDILCQQKYRGRWNGKRRRFVWKKGGSLF